MARSSRRRGGNERLMRLGDIDKLLERANRETDGSYRVVASKSLEGKPIGRIRFIGTRPDDPNDVIAHEDRRELRGYGVFAAWLNHVDAKAINSLDMLVTENGRSFVRHNLIDFGSTLGSGGVGPADYWEGTQYLVEPGSIGRQLIGFGFSHPAWHTTPFYESRSLGRLPMHNAAFNADTWKPRVPNQAFLHAREDDKFWAAQKLIALKTDLLEAAVRAGDFGDAEGRALPGAGAGGAARRHRPRLPDRHQPDRRPGARRGRHPRRSAMRRSMPTLREFPRDIARSGPRSTTPPARPRASPRRPAARRR